MFNAPAPRSLSAPDFFEETETIADKVFVGAFLQRAEDILEIASTGDNGSPDVVIVIDRQGGMRMLDPLGWSLAALSAEYGAAAVYRVERRGSAVRVEGWDGSERCLIQREKTSRKLFHLPGMGTGAYALMPLLPAPATV